MRALCVLLVFVPLAVLGFRLQSAGARGRLTCDGKPAANTLVKLFDEDDGGIDDLMDSKKSDGQGSFQLSGSTRELTPIDPKLNIYTSCQKGMNPCKRKITIKIPNSYIHNGGHVEKWYEMGSMELSGKFPGEKHDCIH